MLLPHEKLQVYQQAHAFALACDARSRAALRSRPDLADQLRRASASIVLNIAEGAAETRPREKARFYRIARRSGNECLAILALLADLGLVSPETYAQARGNARRILWLVNSLTSSMDKRS